MVAHGAVLRAQRFSAEQVEAIARDYRAAGLPAEEVAMMAFAEKVALHAWRVTPEDIEVLRRHGFTDEEILDIALAASARSFFSKVLDAVGAEPDPHYHDLEPSLRRALAVGRPFETA